MLIELSKKLWETTITKNTIHELIESFEESSVEELKDDHFTDSFERDD